MVQVSLSVVSSVSSWLRYAPLLIPTSIIRDNHVQLHNRSADIHVFQMNYDTPLSPQGRELTSLPMREQLRRGFKDMGSRSYSSAKNFGKIGFLFSICECTGEGFRAKNDLWNSAAGGAAAGAILARNAGPQAMLLGGGGFAAFSTGIDWYMRRPEAEI